MPVESGRETVRQMRGDGYVRFSVCKEYSRTGSLFSSPSAPSPSGMTRMPALPPRQDPLNQIGMASPDHPDYRPLTRAQPLDSA